MVHSSASDGTLTTLTVVTVDWHASSHLRCLQSNSERCWKSSGRWMCSTRYGTTFLSSFLKVFMHGRESVGILSQCLLYIRLYYTLCYISYCDICKTSNERRKRKIFRKRGLLGICKELNLFIIASSYCNRAFLDKNKSSLHQIEPRARDDVGRNVNRLCHWKQLSTCSSFCHSRVRKYMFAVGWTSNPLPHVLCDQEGKTSEVGFLP